MSRLDVQSLIKSISKYSFESCPFYIEDGDMIQYYFYDADCYSDWQSDFITLYKTFKNDQVSGIKISNVSVLLKNISRLEDIKNLPYFPELDDTQLDNLCKLLQRIKKVAAVA